MSDPTVCTVCGWPVMIYNLCDVEEGAWCELCFPSTPCGKGEHGEGCPTHVIEDSQEQRELEDFSDDIPF